MARGIVRRAAEIPLIGVSVDKTQKAVTSALINGAVAVGATITVDVLCDRLQVRPERRTMAKTLILLAGGVGALRYMPAVAPGLLVGSAAVVANHVATEVELRARVEQLIPQTQPRTAAGLPGYRAAGQLEASRGYARVEHLRAAERSPLDD